MALESWTEGGDVFSREQEMNIVSFVEYKYLNHSHLTSHTSNRSDISTEFRYLNIAAGTNGRDLRIKTRICSATLKFRYIKMQQLRNPVTPKSLDIEILRDGRVTDFIFNLSKPVFEGEFAYR